ncbi:glutaredoxin family protein [Dactylosporangium sp. AC04546]|uniref:glutaredoxin family protein n=1 Tax=Dactylosporangium sp. AC04546 TaxID=2862460 RepID=UPI001EDF01D4|nr:glutaredoxin family protein [Dactylosporangium sp. AC04546]WVK84568.1 glutaredoxin family protein [Dactylosporangium sp. AC04546]
MRLTLITRPGCHLCDDAKEIMARVAAATGEEWTEVDITGDEQLEEEYGFRIPVVLLDGKEHGYWRVEEERLLRDLRLSSPG